VIVSFRGKWPVISETAFIAPSADIIGDVEIGESSSVWLQVVIGGDVNTIRIGALVTKGMECPEGHLIMGSPAKVIRPLKLEELAFLRKSTENYVGDSREYQAYMQGPKRLGTNNRDLESLEDLEEGFGSSDSPTDSGNSSSASDDLERTESDLKSER